ncbi:hypothetical protein ACROYT_G015009 [Oculina patagonica]
MDSQITVLSHGSIEIGIFRKETHTNKYIDFAHNPMKHKEAVVKTLLNRANLLPSKPDLKSSEQDPVTQNLRPNGYPDVLFKKCVRDRTRERHRQERPLGLAVIPYGEGLMCLTLPEEVVLLYSSSFMDVAFKVFPNCMLTDDLRESITVK